MTKTLNPISGDDSADNLATAGVPQYYQPTTPAAAKSEANAAADLIRQKLDRIYADEPDAKEEIAEITTVQPQSKHQQFMAALNASGKSLADIQTEWHHYYITLPDNEKHEVWQEFYSSNVQGSKYHAAPKPTVIAPVMSPVPDQTYTAQPTVRIAHPAPAKRPFKPKDLRSPKAIKSEIVHRVSAGGKLKPKHHLQSLFFGLGMGSLVLFIFLFGFFNEVIIAPFIQPSRHASATPLIISSDSVAPTTTPEVIIPKINVEIPVDYSQTSIDENTIENALETGVVHYPTTAVPGQNGNAAYFGHSSNNIFNKGKYKFAFVLLHELVEGDTFYLTNNGKVYVYKVISRTVVDPSEVSVLLPVDGQTATATLITCDPPGTSLKRLVVVGQQISPDPSTNTAASTPTDTASQTSSPASLPGNGPTAWSRFWKWIF